MNPTDFLETVLTPGLAWLQQTVGDIPPPSREARLPLLAIAGQESAWTYRKQIHGPAHGWFMFERAGGVAGVMSAAASADKAYRVAKAAGVVPVNVFTVYDALARPAGDSLAVAFGRLLLWTDPRPLPPYGNEEAAWLYYTRNWRPGAVSRGGQSAEDARDRWTTTYGQALLADRQSGESP